MNKKETQEKLNNPPKPVYFYNRYDGKITKWEIDKISKIIIEQETGFVVGAGFVPDEFDITEINKIILGKNSYNIIDLVEQR